MVLSLYTSEMGSSKDNILVFSLENKDDVVRVEPIIEQHSNKNKLLSVAHNRQGFYRYEYLISLKNETDQAALFKTLDEMEILLNVRITNQEDLYPHSRKGIYAPKQINRALQYIVVYIQTRNIVFTNVGSDSNG